MEAVKFIFTEFENFIRRAILPSLVLFGILFFVDFIWVNKALYNEVQTSFKPLLNNEFLLYLILTIVLMSISYILSIFTQFAFDNFIKSNYDSKLFQDETLKLGQLRNEVVSKLHSEKKMVIKGFEFNDFLLYQILGGILSKSTNTSRYADDSKAAGIVFSSIIIAFVWIGLALKTPVSLVIMTIGTIVVYVIGYEYIKSKYRSRAFRLYINYLLEKE